MPHQVRGFLPGPPRMECKYIDRTSVLIYGICKIHGPCTRSTKTAVNILQIQGHSDLTHQKIFNTLQDELLPVVSRVVNPFKWPYKWVTRVITLVLRVITPLRTGVLGPSCRSRVTSISSSLILFCRACKAAKSIRWASFV